MGPEARDGETELCLVGDAEADRARRPVGQLDIERQLAVGVERGRGLDSHRVEHAERGELAAQGLDLGGIVGFALLERHAALQPDGVDLVGARETHRAHAGKRTGFGDEGHRRLARGMVDHDVALDAGQRIALLAQLGDELVLCFEDGSGVGRIARRQAKPGTIDRRQRRLCCRPTDRHVANAIARPGRHVEGEGNRLSLRPRVDGVEGARLGDRPAVDRGRDRGVVVAARAQGGIDPGQRRLGALQQAEAVAAQRLILFEALDQFLEVGLHLLVSADDESDLCRPCLGRTAGRHHEQCDQRHQPAEPCRIAGLSGPQDTGSETGSHDRHALTLGPPNGCMA